MTSIATRKYNIISADGHVIEPADLPRVFDDELRPQVREEQAPRRRVPARRRLRPEAGWKQAIVLAEVLGSPLATRPPQSGR